MPRHRKKIIDIASAIALLALVMLDVALWKNMLAGGAGGAAGAAANGASVLPAIYFLPVTQGESALLVLPGGVTVLTDAGSDAVIVNDLQKVLPASVGSYIDLAIISYPQSADYAGYQYLLAHYDVGAFIYNGRADAAHKTQWTALTATIAARHIPLITVGTGDRILFGAGAAAVIDILSPDAAFARSPDPADTGIVQKIITPKFSVLLAADIGTNVEGVLLARGNGVRGNGATSTAASLHASILKAPFPGVGTAAGNAFLRAVAPRVIIVMPGVKAAASAPTKAMLAHLASSTRATIASPKAGTFLLYNK